MLLDLKFSILTLSITAGTFVAALYGMNLKNFIEESDVGFYGISAWCTVFGCLVAVYGLTKLRKVQRLSMWGHGGGTKTTNRGWGLGAWGGRSPRLDGGGGEGLNELMQRERALAKRLASAGAKRLAKAEARADEAARSGA